MLRADTGERLITNYTPAQQRGRDACVQIRDKINGMRWVGIEPKAVWIGQSTAADMCALWQRMAGDDWDGVLNVAIAGVPMFVGSTGGHDYLFEYYETRDEAERARLRSSFNPVDNPLQGTH